MSLEQTLIMAFYRRGGMWKATRAMDHLAAWGIYRENTDGPYTQQRYSDYWRQSMSTTTREVRAFKACVPEGVTEDQLWDQVRDSMLLVLDRDEATARLMGLRWSA